MSIPVPLRLGSAAILPLLLAGSSVPADAWPAEAYRSMVFDTMRLLPPALGRVLWRRSDAVSEGVSSLEGTTASSLARDGREGTLSAELAGDVESRIDRIVHMVDEHDSFDEIAREFGKLLRIAADLADPTVVGAGRDDLRRVAPEYVRFVGLNLDRVPLVFDRGLPSPLDGASVSDLLSRLRDATRASIEPLGTAFWKDGRVLPAESFDYRSIPYGELSLSYSRGVTAASYLWLSAWKNANGDFTGYRFSKKSP
ncbi:MAG TPA: hypothetical protein VLK65_23980 [Vicinamibacteria bacterium]|nr:hypothetical protein [Vicinamibacteria bacterium]